MCGAVAQLGERNNGIVEVASSILAGSTRIYSNEERSAMRHSYLMLSAGAFAVAIFASVAVHRAPPPFVLPFVVSIVANFVFSFGAFIYAQVLAAAQQGRALPEWERISRLAMGFAAVAVLFSLGIFLWSARQA